MTHYAAGILPVTRYRGETLFLVGQDARDKLWSDFGGKCERVDRGDPVNTACREFYEETHGCVVDHRALRAHVAAPTTPVLRGRTQNGHPYHMYLVEMPFRPHLRSTFLKSLAFLKYKNLCKFYIEKTDVQWVTWDVLVGDALPKRPVFAATLAAHPDVLRRAVAAGAADDRQTRLKAGDVRG